MRLGFRVETKEYREILAGKATYRRGRKTQKTGSRGSLTNGKHKVVIPTIQHKFLLMHIFIKTRHLPFLIRSLNIL
jgi:hypothetical protein